VSKEAAQAAEAAKGSYGVGIGEEWMCWLPVTWALRDLADALDAGGAPAPNAATQRPDGQWVVDVFPLGCAAGPHALTLAAHSTGARPPSGSCSAPPRGPAGRERGERHALRAVRCLAEQTAAARI